MESIWPLVTRVKTNYFCALKHCSSNNKCHFVFRRTKSKGVTLFCLFRALAAWERVTKTVWLTKLQRCGDSVTSTLELVESFPLALLAIQPSQPWLWQLRPVRASLENSLTVHLLRNPWRTGLSSHRVEKCQGLNPKHVDFLKLSWNRVSASFEGVATPLKKRSLHCFCLT